VRRRALFALSFAALLAVELSSAPAAAAPCGRPDLLDTAPPDGAQNVPTNARLFARYTSIAEYLGEDIVFTPEGETPITVKGDFDATEGLLSVEPPQALLPGKSYAVSWPRLRGFGTANLGRGKDISFVVGTASDEAPPTFAGVRTVDWDVTRDQDDCTDRLERRYVFDIGLEPASDDGGRESLMLVVFQTRGPGLAAPKPVSVRRLPAEGQSVTVKQTIDDGAGEVCFAAIVRDLTGKASASGAREICTETVEPPFFEGCSAGAGDRPAHSGAFAWAALLALLWARRRQ
jgi:MYXO-CTERM domain-containing protein